MITVLSLWWAGLLRHVLHMEQRLMGMYEQVTIPEE